MTEDIVIKAGCKFLILKLKNILKQAASKTE